MDHFYHSLIMNSSTGYAHFRILWDEAASAVDLQIIEVNDAYQQMMDLKDEHLAGRKVSTLKRIAPDEWPVEAIERYACVAETGQSETFEFEAATRQKWYQVEVLPVAPDEIACRYHDITQVKKDYIDKKKLEQELKEQLALSDLFFTHSIDGLFFMMLDEPVVWDDTVDKAAVMEYIFGHHRITRVNPAMEAQYRTAAENLVGATPRDMFAHDIEAGKRVWTDFFDKGRLQTYTDERRFDGTAMWVKGDYICLYDDQGRITGHYGIQADVTARKEAEDALIQSEELLKATQELGNVGGFEYDVTTRQIRWTEEMYRIHDMDPSLQADPLSLKEMTLNCLDGEYREKMEQAIDDMLSDHTPVDLETAFTTLKGNRKWIHFTGRPVTENGQLVRIVGSMLDITHLKEVQHSLEEARKEAEAAVQAKTMFLANMSHEIRTPIHGIMGMLELLADSPLNEEQQELLQFSQSSSQSLLRIINDILDYSKMESGGLVFEMIPFNLQETLREISGIYGKLAAEKGLEMVLDMDQQVPHWIQGDPHRFRQVMNNLLSNAVKYTREGRITIRVALDSSEAAEMPEKVALKIAVEDTGIGIPSEKMPQLFEKFSQMDSSHARLYGGTGLGLAIAKNIVEHMKGRIWAESRPGAGSTFAFTCHTLTVEEDSQ
ncbi:MAG: ATP-binding protein [Bacillota bacterium]|nr:ATP-binding protein [Bacillota bacterium]